MKKEKIPTQLFAEYAGENRLQMIVDNCYDKEKRTYQKEFTPDEIEVFRSNLSDAMIEINTLGDEFKELRKNFAVRMDPIKKSIGNLLDYIKHKSRTVTEDVFLFDYQEDGIMACYNADGELVSTRKLLPAERQMKMRVLKTGTEA